MEAEACHGFPSHLVIVFPLGEVSFVETTEAKVALTLREIEVLERSCLMEASISVILGIDGIKEIPVLITVKGLEGEGCGLRDVEIETSLVHLGEGVPVQMGVFVTIMGPDTQGAPIICCKDLAGIVSHIVVVKAKV